MSIDPKTLAATSLLAAMLTGIPEHNLGDELVPNLSLSEIRSEGAIVYTTIVLPSGDRFKVSVEWDSEASP